MIIVVISVASAVMVAWLVWRGSRNLVSTIIAAPAALLLLTILPALIGAAVGRHYGWTFDEASDMLPIWIVLANVALWGALAYWRFGDGR